MSDLGSFSLPPTSLSSSPSRGAGFGLSPPNNFPSSQYANFSLSEPPGLSFAPPSPALPPNDRQPAPLPSEDKLVNATQIGSNLLAMLDQTMKEHTGWSDPSVFHPPPHGRGAPQPPAGFPYPTNKMAAPTGPTGPFSGPLNTSALFGGPPTGGPGPRRDMGVPYTIPMEGMHHPSHPGMPPHYQPLPPGAMGTRMAPTAHMNMQQHQQQQHQLYMQQMQRHMNSGPQSQMQRYPPGQGPPMNFPGRVPQTPSTGFPPMAMPPSGTQMFFPPTPSPGAPPGRMLSLQEIEEMRRRG